MKRSHSEKSRGIAVCAVGVLCNLLLSAAKIAAGVLFGLVSVAADGVNNLSDCGSGIVALVSFHIAEKPADREHPFGHRRAEYIASMIAGFFVLALSVELLRESITTIVRGDIPQGTWIVYLILCLSILVKGGMCLLYHIYAKKLDSKTLKAASIDSLCDCLATIAVIAGTLLCPLLPSADGYAGIALSLFILWQGIKILKETSSELLGSAPDPVLADAIKSSLLAEKDVLGVHDLQIYSYGKGVSFATIHAEMDASIPMLDAHTVIDELEHRVKRETGVTLTIHIDPVDLSNAEESRLRLLILEEARNLAEGLELHDLRMVQGTQKVEFDVGVPYACKLSDEAIFTALTDIVKRLGAYEPIIRIERE